MRICVINLFGENGSARPLPMSTRPDTRLPQSRAGGQGPYLRSPEHLGRSSEAKDSKNSKEEECGGQTKRPTDLPMDRQTRWGVVLCSARLKKENLLINSFTKYWYVLGPLTNHGNGSYIVFTSSSSSSSSTYSSRRHYGIFFGQFEDHSIGGRMAQRLRRSLWFLRGTRTKTATKTRRAAEETTKLGT